MTLTCNSLRVFVRYSLYVESAAGVSPCGNRLGRGKPFPCEFVFDSESEALAGAAMMMEYLGQKADVMSKAVTKSNQRDIKKLEKWKALSEAKSVKKSVEEAG